MSLNDGSFPLKLVPEVVLILAEIFVPVGVIDVICGFIASKGIFWVTRKSFPPPVLVVLNETSVDAVDTLTW